MSKLLTPPEVVQAIIDGKKVEIRGALSSHNDEWSLLNEYQTYIRLLTNGLFMFRLAQEMVTIGDVSFPKPESEPLKYDEEYWVADPAANNYVSASQWSDKLDELVLLRSGLIHLTRENAIEHAKALIKLSGGECE